MFSILAPILAHTISRSLARSLMIEAASATKRRLEMKSHCRPIFILAIAYSLLGLLSYTAQMKVKNADEARAAQINDGSETGLLAERSLDSNPVSNIHFNHLASESLAISPQASTTFIVN